jgi:RimJ/RimL family protein N-acetyltransferase
MFARTQRLTLRPGWVEDAPALTQAIAHESVVTNLSRVPWPYRESDALWWLTRPASSDDIAMSVFAHEGAPQPRLVGGIGLHRSPDMVGYEVGYWLTPDAWGHGYATEAGRALLGIARYAVGLRRLNARHFVDNPASGKVLRKLGFRPIGTGTLFSAARGREVECVTFTRDLDEEERPAMPVRLAA